MGPRLTPAAMIVLAALAAGGCSDQRAIHVIESSGARAMDEGQYDLAAQEYAEVVERRPGRWRARLEHGRALLNLREYELAREEFEVVYTRQPTDEVLELLALAMLESGETDAMARLLRDRVEDDGGVEDWVRLGRFLRAAGDHDAAERALLAGAAVDRGVSAEVQYQLALLYDAIGDEPKAVERLAMAHWIDPEDERVIELIRSYDRVPGPTFARTPRELNTSIAPEPEPIDEE